jgi:hypothetical protein
MKYDRLNMSEIAEEQHHKFGLLFKHGGLTALPPGGNLFESSLFGFGNHLPPKIAMQTAPKTQNAGR